MYNCGMNIDVIKVPLEQLLADRKKSIYALAKETNISYTALWKLKEGRTQGISFDILEKVCRNLDCTPNDLLALSPDEKPKPKAAK